MNSRDLKLFELPSPCCKCVQLARVVVAKMQSSEDSSLLDPLCIAQLCASRLRISRKKVLEVKNEEYQKNVIRIIHREWCGSKLLSNSTDGLDQNVFEYLVLNEFKDELKELQERKEYCLELAKEKRIMQQNVELVDRSAIYLKQSLWFIRSVSAHHFPVKHEFADSDTNALYQMIYGGHPRGTKGTLYAATRFEVFAISPHGNRFAMHNTVDIRFGHRIPESDREVHLYVYRRNCWEHMGSDTSHYMLQSSLSHYSTYPQYKLIVQYGYLALPVLQQVEYWLPLSLLFEIICYAAPFYNGNDPMGDYDMRRLSPDQRVPNLLQFQRYLCLNSSEKVSEDDGNKNDAAQASCLDYSDPLLPFLNANRRRTNTKRAFERIKNSVKFDASEYNPACWWRLWEWNSDQLLCLRRISTPSHLKLAFFWKRQVYPCEFQDRRSIKPLLSQCLRASRHLWRFLTHVVPKYANIGQADDGVLYVFPMEMDLQTVDAHIDQFLLASKWTLQENPKESEAKSKKQKLR